MNFTPVSKFSNRKYPIWELTDINIPDEVYKVIQEGTWNDYNKVTNNSKYKQPATRFTLDDYNESITSDLSKDIISFIRNQKDYDLSLVERNHPNIIDKMKHYRWKIQPVKDIAKYKLGTHTDGQEFVGTAIINLEDNKTVTEYYADKDSKRLIYKGSGIKGTGVLHLNTPFTYHRVRNTTGEDRYILHCILSNPEFN